MIQRKEEGRADNGTQRKFLSQEVGINSVRIEWCRQYLALPKQQWFQ